ncbi:hypothetical protein HC891_00320, partial [Candidatus Gracilibacteria bacterium]|nr:hypothetical protein [Candidatus Gracilibacteria bacterium]
MAAPPMPQGGLGGWLAGLSPRDRLIYMLILGVLGAVLIGYLAVVVGWFSGGAFGATPTSAVPLPTPSASRTVVATATVTPSRTPSRTPTTAPSATPSPTDAPFPTITPFPTDTPIPPTAPPPIFPIITFTPVPPVQPTLEPTLER